MPGAAVTAVTAVRAALKTVPANAQAEVCVELLRYTMRVDPGKILQLSYTSSAALSVSSSLSKCKLPSVSK